MPKPQPMADSRDMIVIHDMFRREFRAIPGLVSGVPEGDTARVGIVADHVAWMVTFLHAHHEGEDLHGLAPAARRVPAEIDPLIETMETQHAGLAMALDDLKAKGADWRTTSAARGTRRPGQRGDRLAGRGSPTTWTSRNARCSP